MLELLQARRDLTDQRSRFLTGFGLSVASDHDLLSQILDGDARAHSYVLSHPRIYIFAGQRSFWYFTHHGC
jgi:hypothetical protein